MHSAKASPPRPSASTQPPANDGRATHTATTHEQKDCPLFRLPPELRNKIYEYALSESQPVKKTTTRLPIADPIEVLDWDDAQDLRPSNALLATCRIIHAEARGIFVTAQRAFWASNNFLIVLKSDWEGATEAPTEPNVTITNLRPEYFSLMPRVVVAVRECEYLDEFHLVKLGEHGKFAWDYERFLPHEDPRLKSGYQRMQALSEADEFDNVLGKITGSLVRAAASKFSVMELRTYAQSAKAYVRSTTTNFRDPSRIEQHMLSQMKRLMRRQNRSLKRDLAGAKMEVLSAVLQHLCDLHDVQLRPRDKS